MNTTDSQEIEVAGKVITLTRQIESRLVALGASGSGLREKTESLAGRLSPEVEKLLAFLGCIRNRIAHEDQARITPEELQFFEEAAAAVLEELGVPQEAAAKPQPPAQPAKSQPAPAIPAAAPAENIPPGTPVSSEESAIPRQAGWIPLLHLVYALSLAGAALRPARRILLLGVLELGLIALCLFALLEGHFYLAGLAGSLFLLSYAAIFYEGWFRSRERIPPAFFLIPGANLAWLLRELLRLTGWFRLAAAFTILAVWVVAILLAFRREFIAAGVLALLSYLVSVAATFLPTGGSGK